MTSGPGGALTGLSCAAPPVQAFGVFPSVKSTTVGAGVVVYDLGQNASFMPQITVHGPAGSYVVITPAELINGDGTIYLSDGTPSYWRYTLSGAANGETWMPRFTYRSCRYLQIQDFAAPAGGAVPVVNSIEGINIHSASTAVGTFSCSNSLFNNIHSLVRWAQLSNMESVLTDCPQREKMGWLEQDHLNGSAIRYEFDLGQLYTKVVNDISENQQANGFIATTAPEYRSSAGAVVPGSPPGAAEISPEWGSTFILAAWQQYQFNGDLKMLSANYSTMKNLVAYMGTQASGNILLYGLATGMMLGLV